MEAAAVLKSVDMLSKIVGSSFVLKEIYSIWKNEEEIKILADTVDCIRDVLFDLQGVQTLDARDINCYNRLRQVFLDAEDFLDRVQTIKKKKDYEARMIKQAKAEIRRKGKGKLSLPYTRLKIKPLENKVSRFFSGSNQAKHAVKVHNKIKEISKQFEAISKNLESFNRKGKEPISTSEETPIDARARGSKVDTTRLIGRDEDKRKIVDLLLRSCVDERRIPVISVSGIGGMGKTTVAQLVYGDQNWQGFDMKLWVYDFKKYYELKPLLHYMLKAIDPYATYVDSLAENHLRDLFVDKIGGKSFFLVLDDVDNENPWKWEHLESWLNHGNRKESRILVTTRLREETKVVRFGLIHELKGLSDEDSLELFEKFAFEERRDGISDELVNQIVKKCCGVPLALKVIGSFLYRKDTREWERVRNSNSLANIDEGKDLLPVLKTSYDDLDRTEKQCFSLCAVFPKNSVIPGDILGHLWVTNIHFKTVKGETLEDVCEKHSRILYSRCFLERTGVTHFNMYVRGNILSYRRSYFKMHDLMYDLAQEVDPNLKVETVEEKIRHLCITDGTPNFQLKRYRLRSIIRFGCPMMQNMFSPSFVSKCPFLRVLDLRYCGIENLTDSVGKLIHLRYLNLAGNNFQTLPKSITELINLRHLDLSYCKSLTHLPSGMDALISLEVLDLSNCGIRNLTDSVGKLIHLMYLYLARNNFQTLPKSITELINLRHLDLESCESLSHLPSGMDALISLEVLDLRYCYGLVELPTGIEKMTHLKEVRLTSWHRLGVMPSGMGALMPAFRSATFRVGHPGSSSHAQLEELGPISDLPGHFTIVLPKNITSKAATQDGEALLLNKKRLWSLTIEWEYNPRLEEEVPAIHEDILAKLQPSVNLQCFVLCGYQGMTFPPWVAQHGFASVLPNLDNIHIENCRRCRYLPSLSRLECLTRLALAGLRSLEYIQENLSASPFCLPKLECLELHGLPELKGWCRVLAAGANDNDGEDMRLMLSQSFPCLARVSLIRCPNFPDSFALFSLNNPSLPFVFSCDNGKLELPKNKNGSWTMTFSEMKTEVAPRYMTRSLREVSDRLTDLCIKNCDRLKTVTGLS